MSVSNQNNLLQSQIQLVREHLQKIYSLPEEQINKLLRVTVSGLKENMNMAQKALADADHTELGFISHTMKGSLLSIGLAESSELARVIEHHAANNDDLAYDELISKLRTSIEELLEYKG